MSPRLRRSLRDCCNRNAVTWGIHLGSRCPQLIESLGLSGFQWLFLDAEHKPLSPECCRDLVRAADVVGMPCVVRVPEVQPAVIAAFLDAGVRGILAPHVESVEQARTLVAACRVDPNTFTAALIESVRGLETLESIMAVAGLDCVAIGPNDLGRSLGIHTGMADPQVRARVREAEVRIESYGKPRLTVVTDVEQARAARASGARLIAVSDAALVRIAGCLFLETAT